VEIGGGGVKDETKLIIGTGFAILLLTLLSFWNSPIYTAGVALGFSLLGDAFKILFGYLFGRSLPQQIGDAKPGQTSESNTKITTTPEPPPEVKS
jgi:hypothetical protein